MFGRPALPALSAPSTASPAKRSRPDRRELGAAIALTLLAAGSLASPFAGPALAQTPERIVAVGGVVTEVIYALGLQDKIAGVDSTSQYPAEALKQKANVGYVRALSAEGVLSLKPSLVIAIQGAGPPDAISLVNEAGVKLARIPDDTTAEGVATKIEAIGAVVGAVEPARRLAAQTKARFEELAAVRSGIARKRRVLFVLSLQNGRALVGGRNSSADAIIGLAGGINVASDIEGFKPMTDEAIIAAAPEVIVMMSHSSSHNAPADELFAMPSFSQTPAATARSLVRMDGLYLLGFGPRAPMAARDLMAAIYPDSAIPQLKTAAAP